MTIMQLQGLKELDASAPLRERTKREETQRMEAHDSLDISESARQAAEATKLARKPSGAEVRMEQVEAAKARIQNGSYKLTEVVLEVASRIAAHM